MSKAKELKYRKALREVGRLVDIANIYAADGALLTASQRLKEASEEMEKAHYLRIEIMGL